MSCCSVALVSYSSVVIQRFNFAAHTSSASLQSAIMSAAYQNAGTVTGAALDFVRTSVLVPAAGYRGGHAAVLVVTDGNSQDSVQPAADMLKAVAAVHAVGVGQEISVSQLNDIASTPASEHVYLSEIGTLATDLALVLNLTKAVGCGAPVHP